MEFKTEEVYLYTVGLRFKNKTGDGTVIEIKRR